MTTMAGKASGRTRAGAVPGEFPDTPGGFRAAQMWAWEAAKLEPQRSGVSGKWMVAKINGRWRAMPPSMANAHRRHRASTR